MLTCSLLHELGIPISLNATEVVARHGLPCWLIIPPLLIDFKVGLVLAYKVPCCTMSLNFTKNFSRNLESVGSNSFMPLKKVCLVSWDMKLVLAWRLPIKNSSEFHENLPVGLVADTRSQTVVVCTCRLFNVKVCGVCIAIMCSKRLWKE